MDEAVFSWLNQWNGRYELMDSALRFAQTGYVKGVPSMLVVWALWFLPKSTNERTEIRESLCAALLCTVPIMAIARALAIYMPFSPRPIHTPGLEINLHRGQSPVFLDGWSSMPSDHASLFIGFAVAILTIHLFFGVFIFIWTIFLVCIPRIVLGLHWPSDIIVGALLGAIVALMLISPLTRFVRHVGLIKFFEAREVIGYPLLFLTTYEITQRFTLTRYLISALIE